MIAVELADRRRVGQGTSDWVWLLIFATPFFACGGKAAGSEVTASDPNAADVSTTSSGISAS